MRAEKHFWSKVNRAGPDECWLWTAATYDGGYGHYWDGEDMMPAHRAAYQYEHDEEPDDVVMHTCDNPACVNPAHLVSGTQADNMQDASEKDRCGKPDSKLTEDDVREIRNKYEAGGVTYPELASEYGVHKTTIGWIVRRESWTHVD